MDNRGAIMLELWVDKINILLNEIIHQLMFHNFHINISVTKPPMLTCEHVACCLTNNKRLSLESDSVRWHDLN